MLRVPTEFVWVRGGRRIALVHRAVERTLAPLLLSAPHGPPGGGEPLAGGRGAAYRVVLAEGTVVVVRLYRRGGLLARVVRETYCGWPPRPFLEVVVTEEARRRGLLVPEVLGARIDRLWAGCYRGLLVTRDVAGAQTLWAALAATGDAAVRQRLLRAAGRAVRALHDAGIQHRDLNLNNLLVRETGAGTEIVVIDFDRAHVHARPVGAARRRRALRRLGRSARKLDPAGAVIDAAGMAALRTGGVS